MYISKKELLRRVEKLETEVNRSAKPIYLSDIWTEPTLRGKVDAIAVYLGVKFESTKNEGSRTLAYKEVAVEEKKGKK